MEGDLLVNKPIGKKLGSQKKKRKEKQTNKQILFENPQTYTVPDF